ncbi:hypothetical protein J4E81_006504 [Alternaria sp. BMP 2799]|nr:hypothetical protein J4E81_006504 [Alternaria sp. BMP 2799]
MSLNRAYRTRTPLEASIEPEDTKNWYCDFWQHVCAVPHKDGKSIILYEPKETQHPDPRVRPEWASKRLRKAYELLGEGHPRIVRRTGLVNSDAGNGVLVERLTPGPHWGDLPAMTLPVPEKPSREDRIMLALYYRWALQSLSAIAYFHSRSVYLTFFSSTNVWLRSDYSLAIAGFINVDGPELDAESRRDAWKEAKRSERRERRYQEWYDAGAPISVCPEDESGEESEDESEEIPELFSYPWDTGEWVGDGGAIHYEEYSTEPPEQCGSHRESLFYWATFVWELMTNTQTAEAHWKQGIEWDPLSPPEGGPPKPAKDWRDQLQVLEEARLGSVLLKAWKSEYQSAEQAAEDVRKIAEEMGIKIVSSASEVDDAWTNVSRQDEVDIGEPWEDVFELDEARERWGARTIRFKRQGTHVILPVAG